MSIKSDLQAFIKAANLKALSNHTPAPHYKSAYDAVFEQAIVLVDAKALTLSESYNFDATATNDYSAYYAALAAQVEQAAKFRVLCDDLTANCLNSKREIFAFTQKLHEDFDIREIETILNK